MLQFLSCLWSRSIATDLRWNDSSWSWLEQGLIDLQDKTVSEKVEISLKFVELGTMDVIRSTLGFVAI